jgi:hypothetical protein
MSEPELRQPELTKIRAEDTKETLAADPNDFFAGMLAAITERTKALQSSVESKINKLQENSDRLQRGVVNYS